MKITLGTFAFNAIGARSGARASREALLALREYAEKLRAGQSPIGIPSFCRGQAIQDGGPSLDLAVDEETRRALEREATRQGATVEELAVHAVLVYLAELDRRLGTASGVTPSAGALASAAPRTTRA
jgi:hypothetical protein